MRLDHNEIITILSRARICPSILNCQRPLFFLRGQTLNSFFEFGVCPRKKNKQVSGDRTERVTPVPIPNTEVKPLRADGTARATLWETRSLPGLNQKAPLLATSKKRRFFCTSGHFISANDIHPVKSRGALRISDLLSGQTHRASILTPSGFTCAARRLALFRQDCPALLKQPRDPLLQNVRTAHPQGFACSGAWA